MTIQWGLTHQGNAQGMNMSHLDAALQKSDNGKSVQEVTDPNPESPRDLHPAHSHCVLYTCYSEIGESRIVALWHPTPHPGTP